MHVIVEACLFVRLMRVQMIGHRKRRALDSLYICFTNFFLFVFILHVQMSLPAQVSCAYYRFKYTLIFYSGV